MRCKLIELACDRPDDEAVPFRVLWTYGALADALEEETGWRLSISEVGRTLRFSEIRPHRVKQWLKCSDPDFTAKAKRVCDLYLEPPDGAVVVPVDEKPMQVLDVRTGRVFGRVVRKRTAEALVASMNALARRYPRRPVYVVWDNLNIHYDGKDARWTRFNARYGSFDSPSAQKAQVEGYIRHWNRHERHPFRWTWRTDRRKNRRRRKTKR